MSWIIENLSDDEVRVLRSALQDYGRTKTPLAYPRDQEIARDLDVRLMRAKRVVAL